MGRFIFVLYLRVGREVQNGDDGICQQYSQRTQTIAICEKSTTSGKNLLLLDTLALMTCAMI